MSWLALTLRSTRDYFAIVALLILSNVFLFFTTSLFLRLLGGVTLFCFLPGLLLINLLFPKLGHFSLERLLLSAGASYVLSTFCVLAVHFMPGEITLNSICIALNGLVSALLVLNLLLQKIAAERSDDRWFSKESLPQIVLLVALAAFFRFAYLGYSEYQGDEVMVASVAREAIVGRDDALFLHRKGPTEASITIAFALFADGFDEFVTRFPFALASFLGIMVTYLIGRRLFNSFVGFTAGLLLTIEGIFRGISCIVQFPGVVVLMLTLSLYCFYRFYQANDMWSNRWQILGTVFFAFGLLSHWDIVLILPTLAFLYLSKCDLRSLKENALPLVGSLSVIAIMLLVFYVPYILHPYFQKTLLYLTKEIMGAGQGPYNNLYWYISYSIFYNSVYYVAFMSGLLMTVVVGELRRVLQQQWLLYIVSASLIMGLVVPVFLPTGLSVNGANYSFVLFVPWLFILLFSRKITTETKTVFFWFFTYFLICSFAIREPNLHYYLFSPAWAIIAGLGLKRIYDFEPRRLIAGLSWRVILRDFRAIYQRGISLLFIMLYGLFAFYTYLIFIQHDPLYIVGFPERKHLLYRTPQVSYPRSGLFGFPHKSGWKTIGYLYRAGVLRGDYMSNEKRQIPRWYIGERLRDEGMPRYFFYDEYAAQVREDAQRYSKEAIGEYYDLVGRVWVHGEARMLVYGDKRFLSRAAPVDYLSEDYEPRYDELVSLRESYLYERYGKDDYSFQNLARYLDVLAPEGVGLVLNATEQVGILSHYYKGTMPYYPLPKEQIIDEGRTEAELVRIFAWHNQVYVAFWAAEERDPEGFIEKWLDEHAQRVTERWFGNVRLALYAVPGKAEEGIRYPQGIHLEGKVDLVGYELEETLAQSGETIHLTLYWWTLAEMEKDYTVFTHLIDEENRIWAQHDKQPLDGMHPTSEWIEGEVVADKYELVLTDRAPPGKYQIEVGMYDWVSGERVEVRGEEGPLPENRILLSPPILVR